MISLLTFKVGVSSPFSTCKQIISNHLVFWDYSPVDISKPQIICWLSSSGVNALTAGLRDPTYCKRFVNEGEGANWGRHLCSTVQTKQFTICDQCGSQIRCVTCGTLGKSREDIISNIVQPKDIGRIGRWYNLPQPEIPTNSTLQLALGQVCCCWMLLVDDNQSS